MIKAKKSKRFVIGLVFIIMGLSIVIFQVFYYKYLNDKNASMVNEFFELKEQKSIEPVIDSPSNNTQSKKSNNDSYFAILEIPTISLKRGLVSVNSKKNNVNKNIQILQGSKMPDVENSTLYLASHSGSGFHSFFKNLYKVNNNDLIYLYYNNYKYTYQIIDNYKEVKNGIITIKEDQNNTRLVLTTCSQNPKGNQLVYIGKLINKESY